MLLISEHFQYYNRSDNHYDVIQKIDYHSFSSEGLESTVPICFKSDEKKSCLQIFIEDDKAKIENSYYIGLDWIRQWGLPVQIESKMNSSAGQLDALGMLLEALKEPENFKHLDDLMEVKFDEEWIEVKGDSSIHLTPFLLIQFLMIVKSIVRKGLKKDYYRVTENLESRVKGKILVAQQIRQNTVRNHRTKTVCSYQEYGIDTEANRFLKYVLHFVQSQILQFEDEDLKDKLLEPLSYNLGGFQQVSEERFYTFKNKEHNPMFKEYNTAIQLGIQILKLNDHNLSKAAEKRNTYPPHWIDMSKLFELYVFKKLREKFTGKDEVQYHTKVYKQELDFIINTEQFKAVVDAKYKPRYKKGNPSMEDARQLSGYARLNRVYTKLGLDNNEVIPVYFVYPKELQIEELVEDLNEEEEDVFETLEKKITDNKIGQSLFSANDEVRKSTSYRKMYMQEIKMRFTSGKL